MSVLQPPLSILIVEDVPTMRSMLEQLVAALPGCKVSGSAKNGWEARIELSRRRPDLVLLDEVLPGESSLDLLKEMHALAIPVLLITGLEDAAHALPELAEGRLFKPSWDNLAADQARFAAAIKTALDAK